MSAGSSPPEFAPHVLDQAIDWLVKTRSGAAPPQVFAACEQWRAADASHEAAWQALQMTESTLRQASALPGRVALDTLAGSGRLRSRRQALKVLGLGMLGAGAGGLLLQQQPWRSFGADYATGVGERRSFNLLDGTRLQLNTDSAADVLFTEQQRLIVLRDGEIFVRTGLDPAAASGRRPFWVHTREARLQAIGTAFDVRQESGRTRLMVEEGVVAIHLPDARPVLVQAGSEYLIAPGSAQLQPASVFNANGWVSGVLVARQMRLQDLVQELARYRHGWLQCDPAVAQLRVSGVFQLDRIDHALDGLSQSLAVCVERRTRFWTRIVQA